MWYLGLNPLAQSLQLATGTLKTIQEIPYSRWVHLSFLWATPAVLNWNHSWSFSYQTASDGSFTEKEYILFVLALRPVYAIESIGNASQTVAFCYFSLLRKASHLTQVLTGLQDPLSGLVPTPTSSVALPPLMSTQGLCSLLRGSSLPGRIHASIPFFLNACNTIVSPSPGTLPAILSVITIFPCLFLPSFISLQ